MVNITGKIKAFNKFMPACKSAASVVSGSISTVEFEVPAAAALISYTTAAGVNKAFIDADVPGKFGAAVTVSASCRVHGYDFYGQPMTETITVTTVPVTGVKAFAKICALQHVSSASTDLPSVNVTFANTSPLGLPFINLGSLYEFVDGVKSGSLGTSVVGAFTTAQTATSADPRGTYIPSNTTAGKKIKLVHLTSNYTFLSSGKEVGGLEGLAHYSSNAV